MNYETPKLIKDILRREIEVTLVLKGDTVLYDVNTKAKSHLYLEQQRDGSFIGHRRYNETTESIVDIGDAAYAVKSCMYGKGYANQKWIDVMVDLGIIKRVETTVVTYEGLY